MSKYFISIELHEEGSRTHLADFGVTQKFANKVHTLECDAPKLLNALLKCAIVVFINLFNEKVQ